MDEVKATLIMEFILRQPIDDWLAKKILLRLPIPTHLHPHLKKTLFLRRLVSDLASDPIRLSHRTLDALEIIEDLDRSLGVPHPLPALSAAYCAVAAELTVAPLRTAGSSSAEAEFLDAADRIWNVRVPDLERSEGRGLVSEALREWKRKVDDALACADARRKLPRRDTRSKAEEALREYLTVAVDAMGPPMLELMAATVCEDTVTGGCGRAAGPGISTRVGAVDPDGAAAATGTRVVLNDQEEGVLEDSAQARRESLKDRTLKRHLLPVSQGDEVSVYPPQAVENITAEVPVCSGELNKRMREAPAGPEDSGCVAGTAVAGISVEQDAQATATGGTGVNGEQGGEQAELVQDRVAEAPTDPIDPGPKQDQVHQEIAGPSVEKDARPTSTKGRSVEDQGAERPTKVPRTNIMERNPTASTYQWDDDSIETLSDQSGGSPKRPHLSTPRVHRHSPLKLYENTKHVRRRKPKRWTPHEEDALREAVQKHGVGNWKFILKNCPGAFEDRTEVDLKDKWRNMNRYKL